MDSFIKNIQNRFKQHPVMILSWIALSFSVISCILYFTMDDYYDAVFNLIRTIFFIPPYILLVVYMLKFHDKLKYPVMVPIIFGLIVLYSLISFILPLGFRSRGFLKLIFVISCIVAVINILKGMQNKIYVIVAMSLGLLSEAFNLEIIGWYIRERMMFPYVCEALGAICLYVALLLFAIKHKLPSIIISKPKNNYVDKSSPEQSLKLLKDKLELGVITEEEYQVQRADIISKL